MMSEQLYRWVNGRNDKLHPPIDNSDFPLQYFCRFKGDDPHSGWVDTDLMTAEEIKECDYPDYWEWLEPYTPSPVSGSLEDAEPVYHDYKSDWEYHCRVSGGYSYETFLSTLLDDPEFYKIWCSKKTQKLHK